MDNEKEHLLKGSKKRKCDDELELSTKEKPSQDIEDPTEDSFISNLSFQPVLPQRSWTTFVILILTPLLLCPLPITMKSQESKAAYGILIMIVYWVTEVTPLAVTATLPLFIFPILGILTASEVAASYLQDANILFLGGLLVFVAFEECNLHKRIALKVLLLLGTKKPNLIFGFMLTTACISMLLSNTATAAMMVQIVKVILSELEKTRDVQNVNEMQYDNGTEVLHQESSLQAGPSDIIAAPEENEEVIKDRKIRVDKDSENFGKVLMLAVAFSANVGGVATLTGTGTNMIFAGQAKKIFPHSGGVSYSSWFGFAFPLMIVLLLISWAFLVLLFLGPRSFLTCFTKEKGRESKTIQEIIKIEYESLGKISFAEIAVLLHLVVLVLLWLTKEPQFMPGWSSVFRENYVSDGTVAMFIAFLLFQFPSEKPNILCWKRRKSPFSSVRPLLDLQTVSEKLCWNVLVLLGGGFAIAAACQKSGLSGVISRRLSALSSIPDFAVVAVACITVTAMTEILSNTGTATIFLPVLASIATSTHIHPWQLMVPATIACSFAFMFPISTPANAIVYSTGRLKMWDMVKAGFCMDIICLVVLLVFVNTYGSYYYKWMSYPDWAAGVIAHTTPAVNSTARTPS